jgi:SAM-dependent methyltransferase
LPEHAVDLQRPAAKHWLSRLWCELYHWDQFLLHKGASWPQDYASRLDPQRVVVHYLREFAERLGRLPSDRPVEVLDVGAGALTQLGYVWPGRAMNLTAVDALARDYDWLLARYRVEPPVRAQYAMFEELVARFGRDRFDVAHARNALDHSWDPVLGLRQMIEVTRPGGLVVLDSQVNEGERNYYEGLHQWNVELCDGRLELWDRTGHRVDLNAAVASDVDHFECSGYPDGFRAVFRKRSAGQT